MSLTITYLGHSGFLLDDGELTIAVDPFLTDNPVARHKAADIKCDYIALTHGHADHFGDTIEIAHNNEAKVICCYELHEYLSEHNVQTDPGNPGGRIETDFGWVAFTQAFHSSSYNGRYTGMPCGLMINIDDITIYHTGDTGIFGDMKLLGEIYRPEIALICAGDRFTMGPELATRAAEMIGPKVAVPIHWGTWPLLSGDMSGFAPKGIEAKVLEPGEVWLYG
ncbi:MAG: metal-dependent hydrolase [Phycisphaera sp.]|nr:metal-dependent hydrolase [Phycisphaera sp.]